jgi:hypothetical protein
LTPGLCAIAQELLARHEAVAVGVDALEASGLAGVPTRRARDDAVVVAVAAIEAPALPFSSNRPAGRFVNIRACGPRIRTF